MAIITISRQVAALGDETASILAKKLGYKFVSKKELETKIVDLGFSEEKLKKYDERKPGFFASLVKDRDEYLDYLQTAVLDLASQGDCILIGRGAFAILDNLPNLLSFRLVADQKIRLQRLQKEFDWSEKQAQQRIDESDTNRKGFHKSFFNIEIDDPSNYMLVLNTGLLSDESTATIMEAIVKNYITPEKEEEGKKKLDQLLKCQHLVNKLVFEYKINIEFLHAVMEGDTITLQGVSDSSVLVERAIKIASVEFPDYKIKSSISVIQDFKPYS